MTQEDAPQRPPTHQATDFAEIEPEFMRRVARIVWCTLATVDRRDRPRTRISHPIWEVVDGAPVGYWSTFPRSLKAKHIARNPNVSLTYWDPAHEQIYIQAEADWLDTPEEKQRVWDLYKNTPEPLGYDLGGWGFWKDGAQGKNFGVLRLRPTRIELFSIAALMSRQPPIVWKSR